jgi:hypothetical protein
VSLSDEYYDGSATYTFAGELISSNGEAFE